MRLNHAKFFSMNLLRMSNVLEEHLPSACLITNAIAESNIMGSIDDVVSIMMSVENVWNRCILLRTAHFESFLMNQNDSVRQYKQRYQYVSVSDEDTSES